MGWKVKAYEWTFNSEGKRVAIRRSSMDREWKDAEDALRYMMCLQEDTEDHTFNNLMTFQVEYEFHATTIRLPEHTSRYLGEFETQGATGGME